MKRDMDLARLILLKIEQTADDPRLWINMEIPDYTTAEVSYHVMILNEAGLIEADDLSTRGRGNSDWRPKRLTWNGHEFLDAARNDSIWNKAKEKASSMNFELLKEFLLSLIRQQLGAEPEP